MSRKANWDWSGTKGVDTGHKVDYPEICGMYGIEEIEAVVEAMKEPIWTLGRYTKKFQEEFADYVGVKYAYAVTNCASALELAAVLSGIKPGDEVIVSSITFYSTTLGILRLGGKVVFADIDPSVYNITARTIEEKITKKTKAIYAVHLYGLPCDMDPILALAKKHNLYVVEDCAHTPGAEYKGRRTGSIGNFGCFSFHTAKNMTTLGEGGMLTTNDDKAAKIMPALRHVGVKHYEDQERYWLPYLYDIVKVNGYIPYNFCMTDIQAAAGRVQLKKLDELNNRRRKIAKKLIEGLKDVEELQVPYEPEGYRHVFHLFPLLYNGKASNATRDDLVGLLYNKYSIRTVPLYPPVYYLSIYKEMGYKRGLCPVAERVYNHLTNLPMTPTLKDEQVDYMIESIRKAVVDLRNKKR